MAPDADDGCRRQARVSVATLTRHDSSQLVQPCAIRSTVPVVSR